MSGTIFFDSSRNAMKRISGSVSVQGPSTATYVAGFGPLLYVTDTTVAHNLGYTPLFRYGYEPFGDGIIWPSLTEDGFEVGFAQNPLNLSQQGPGISVWPDNNNLHIRIFYVDSSLSSNTYPVYWAYYKDFSL